MRIDDYGSWVSDEWDGWEISVRASHIAQKYSLTSSKILGMGIPGLLTLYGCGRLTAAELYKEAESAWLIAVARVCAGSVALD